MRRTQSRRDQLPAPGAAISLSAMTCRRCGRPGCTIVCLGRDERGAASLAWCAADCARVDGWPGLTSKRARSRVPTSPPPSRSSVSLRMAA